MSVRYLRRPVKSGGREMAANHSSRPVIDVTNDECEPLAQALAYFCVACGRMHASGEVRDGDIHCA